MVNRLAIVLVLLSVGILHAADETPPRSDQEYVDKLIQGGLCEVQAGEIAQMKAKNADVKAFGNRMVKDHTKANGELSSLAAKKSWTVPRVLDEKHKSKIDLLSRNEGENFDREYASMMVESHVKTAELLRMAAKNANDNEFKKWAENTLITVEEHRGHAEQLAAKVGGNTSKQPVKSSYQDDSKDGRTRDTSTGTTKPSAQQNDPPSSQGRDGASQNPQSKNAGNENSPAPGTTKPSADRNAQNPSDRR